MHNLVVCGATNPHSRADGAMFSDFMGISMTLLNLHPDIKGTFLSCFPLDQHFDYLGNWDPPITDIKFGNYGPGNKPLYTYSKAKWATRQDKWFEEIKKEELLGRVYNWIRDKAKTAEKGDVVNMFFQCHGDRKGALMLGTRTFPAQAFADLIQIFKAEVQVNAVGSHCYSGILVDAISVTNPRNRYPVGAASATELHYTSPIKSKSNRIRNFQFAQPFVQSLARVRLPGIPQSVIDPVTVSNHEKFVGEAMQLSVKGTTIATSTPTSFLSEEKMASVALIEELILRETADVNYDKESIHRRRRAEWPTLDLALLRNLKSRSISKATTNSQAAAKSLIDKVASACDQVNFDYADDVILGNLKLRNPNYGEILKALYSRCREQSAVLDLFIILCEKNFLQFGSLREPVNFRSTSADVGNLWRVLMSFEEVQKLRTEPLTGAMIYNEHFDSPMLWLAVMMVRGGSDFAKMIELVEFTDFFGKLDLAKAFPEGDKSPMNITVDPLALAAKCTPGFGVWLPQGLGKTANLDMIADGMANALKKFNTVEKVYKEYFQIGDNELLLESQQDTVLRSHPSAQNRQRHSGQWVVNVPRPPPLSLDHPKIKKVSREILGP